MSYQGHYSQKKQPAKKPRKKTWLIVLCVVLVVILAAAASGFYYINAKLDKITQAEFRPNTDPALDNIFVGNFDDEDDTFATEETVAEVTTEPVSTSTEKAVDYGKTGKILNILVVGQDAREGSSPSEQSKLADSIILCTVNKETKTLTLTSFLRDSYVKLPNYVQSNGVKHECGKQRINVNYSLGYQWDGDLGAMSMLNQCIQENYGVEIDGNVEVDFYATVRLIDTIGGLDIDLTEDEASYLMKMPYLKANFDHTYTPGVNHLNGWECLYYARMRKSSGTDNDIVRTSRQRNVVTLLVNKLKTMSLKQINDLIDFMLPQIITNIDKSDIAAYTLELLPLLPQLEIVSNQCPAEGHYGGKMVEIDGIMQGVITPDFEANRKLLAAICEDND